MKIINYYKQFLKLLVLISFLLSSSLTFGQQSDKTTTDTILSKAEAIKISEISIKSGEVWTQAKKLEGTLLTDEEIKEIKIKNDSLLSHISSLLKRNKTINFDTKKIRFLSNKQLFWKTLSEKLNLEKASLSTEIKILNEYKTDFENEMKVWKNTKLVIQKEDTEPIVIKRVTELLAGLNGIVANIQKKNDKLLSMLDRTSGDGVMVDEFINRIDDVIVKKKSQIFLRDFPPVFSEKFYEISSWQFTGLIQSFYRYEVVELIKYLKSHETENIIQLLLILILIIAVNLIKNILLKSNVDDDSRYTHLLIKIFKHNISAALILGLFASVFIYPNRPELYKDIMRLITLIPLIIISSVFVKKQYYKFLYVFVIITYLQFVYIVFPADSYFSFLSMVVVAILQTFVLLKVVRILYHHPVSSTALNNMLILLLVVFLGFALTGFFALIFGAITLSEVTLNISIVVVFASMLIYITTIIFDGLIVLALKGNYLQKLNFIRLYGVLITRKIISIANFVAIIAILIFMMDVINIKRPIYNAVTAIFTNKFNIGLTSFTLWDIVVFFLVIWLSIIIAKMIRIVLEKDVLNKLSLGKGVPYTIAMMVRYSIITVGVILAVTAAGIPMNNLTVLFGAFGVGIGFGLQDIFNNIVSGFILLFERPLQIGDTIEIGKYVGNVKTIGIRSSNIRTFDGAEVIVPNGQLISNEVINWTLSDQRRRIEIVVGVAYGSDPHKVNKLLKNLLLEHHDVIDDPSPYVYFNEFGESSLNFRLLFWTSYSGEWIRIRSEVMFKIYDTLMQEGISIPYPQIDLHLHSKDEELEDLNKNDKQIS